MKIRRANENDIPLIIEILANDKLGKLREDNSSELLSVYLDAFRKIDAQEHQLLLVAETNSGEIAGTLQLTFIQYLTYKGGLRAQAEAVFVRDDLRGKGYGSALMQEALKLSKEKGAHLIQLTSDKRRPEAVRFYEKLGFVASHEGMKLHFTH